MAFVSPPAPVVSIHVFLTNQKPSISGLWPRAAGQVLKKGRGASPSILLQGFLAARGRPDQKLDVCKNRAVQTRVQKLNFRHREQIENGWLVVWPIAWLQICASYVAVLPFGRLDGPGVRLRHKSGWGQSPPAVWTLSRPPPPPRATQTSEISALRSAERPANMVNVPRKTVGSNQTL